MKKTWQNFLFISFLFAPLSVWAAQGTAVITGTKEGSTLAGEAHFTETADGLLVEVKLQNVPNPGKHGFHIHENGSCAEEGKAAGGHYNPLGVAHGFLPMDGEHKAHSGDMGNIAIAADGTGALTLVLPGISLTSGQYNVLGRAVIVHEKEDDFGQPTGNAGGRIGCGIIIMVIEPQEDMAQTPSVPEIPSNP